MESLPDLPGIKTDLSELLKSDIDLVLLDILLDLLLEGFLGESGLVPLLDLLLEDFLGESGLGLLLDLLLEDFLGESGPEMVEKESRD